MIITIGLACFILVLVMTMQFKIVNQTDITSIETMREAELKTELANWKDKYEETTQKYEETEQTIQEYKKQEQSNIESSELIEQELEQANTILGKTDVQGYGIVITIRDTANEEIGNVTSDDLILIVNALKDAGAEAISINGERIINMSYIVDIIMNYNDSFIKVNGQRIVTPYVIKAIGNQSYLESALVGNGGQVDSMQKLGYDITIEKQSRITIYQYSVDINTKYIE